MNIVVLMGRLVREPELRFTPNSMAVATFTLAVDRQVSKQKKEEFMSQGKATADFIRVTCYGKIAENVNRYLGKGSRALVNGRITTGSYTNKDGMKVYTTDVTADSVQFIDFKSEGYRGQYQPSAPVNQNVQNYNQMNNSSNNSYVNNDSSSFFQSNLDKIIDGNSDVDNYSLDDDNWEIDDVELNVLE